MSSISPHDACDCTARPGQLHTATCASRQVVPTFFPTVGGICGAHGKTNCEPCASAPNYEDAPEFWSQVLGDGD